MKKYIILIPFIFIILLFGGCFYLKYDSLSIEGNGKMAVKESVIEKELKGIRNTGAFEVIIDPSLKDKAILEGESNLLDLVQLNQDSFGMLNLELKPNTVILLHKTITVRIPEFKGGMLQADGSGSIIMQGPEPMQGDLFELRISGSGSIQLNLETKEINISINGSGDVELNGSADKEKANIQGAGDLNAFGLKVKTAEVVIGGSGQANIYAVDMLSGEINGSGNIQYKGNPKQVSVNDNGSGNLNKQ